MEDWLELYILFINLNSFSNDRAFSDFLCGIGTSVRRIFHLGLHKVVTFGVASATLATPVRTP